MTEIRRLTKDDWPAFARMQAISFNYRYDPSDESNNERDPLDHPESWVWAAFEKGNLVAGTYEIDFLMNFDNKRAKMTGIGGVATLPEARGGGYMRRIFDKMLQESYDNGVIFSSLSPFSHDFYRKFGYETTCVRNNITITAKHFLSIKPYGEFISIQGDDDTTLLSQVHSAYIKNINQAVHRDYWPDNRAWKRFAKGDPWAAKGSYLYLWKDENGVTRSYIKYRVVQDDGNTNMAVTELAFIDKKGLYGALGIVGGLSTQYENFKWMAPTFIDAYDFIGDDWAVNINTTPRDMTRVINVKTALELMRTAEGEGEYVIEVTDDKTLPVNNGKYLVQFGKEGAKVSATTKNADITCDILTLSQLVTGYRTLENAMYTRHKDIVVKCNIDTLKNVFTLRPQHQTEYF
ncbi:MAG: GNAT family N-acetyltransferase [Treponema sp.]|nr:GNAT family N-acetyltransferase [Treponema sp.]